jgi:hypothetical protein
MYARIFEQIFTSSIAKDYEVRHVFMDLLVLADQDGAIDMTLEAIAGETAVPKRIIRRAIKKLCKPDPQSRSEAEDGRRLIPLRLNRSWGWQIVNFEAYKELRDEEARRAYMREYMRKYMQDRRNKLKQARETVKPPLDNVKPSLADIDVAAAVDLEAEAAADTAAEKETDEKDVAVAAPPGAATAKTDERAGPQPAVPAAATEAERPLTEKLKRIQEALVAPVVEATGIQAAGLLGSAGLPADVAARLGIKYGYDRVRQVLGLVLKRRAANPPGMVRQALEERWTV